MATDFIVSLASSFSRAVLRTPHIFPNDTPAELLFC